jgi:hypothetical protein
MPVPKFRLQHLGRALCECSRGLKCSKLPTQYERHCRQREFVSRKSGCRRPSMNNCPSHQEPPSPRRGCVLIQAQPKLRLPDTIAIRSAVNFDRYFRGIYVGIPSELDGNRLEGLRKRLSVKLPIHRSKSGLRRLSGHGVRVDLEQTVRHLKGKPSPSVSIFVPRLLPAHFALTHGKMDPCGRSFRSR